LPVRPVNLAGEGCNEDDLVDMVKVPARVVRALPYPHPRRSHMGILLFVLLVVLVATLGFWDTVSALLGAVGVVVLLVVLGIAIAAASGYAWLKRKGS
jgi:uncharacterized membrane protein YkvI